MIADTFAARWQALREERTNLVLGVQPSPKWLRAWSLPDDLDGARRFCDLLLSEAVGRVAAVKVQTPFFERLGPDGVGLLARFVDECRAVGTLTVVDAKRGDASDCMEALASTYLGDGRGLGADAMTVAAPMGFESVRPACDAGARSGACVLVVVRTSDRGSDPLQTAVTQAGPTTSQWLAEEITAANEELAPDATLGPVGAVVGAGPEEALELLRRMPRSLVSLPGLGRPGRTLEQFERAAAEARERVLLPITSGLLSDGWRGLRAKVEEWKTAIAASAIGAQA
ncbi:MAG TPA: orotidine-5'-phosphate decarboxylase [Gaiellaceae bacterium]